MYDINRVSAFIFDMDGTLIDSMSHWRRENRKFFERRSLPLPEELQGDIDTMTSGALVRRFMDLYPGAITYQEGMSEYMECMKVHYDTDIGPKPGALEFLQALKDHGYRMCVATATYKEVAERALQRIGLLPYLEFVTDNVEVGVHKGDKEFFLRVADRLNVAPCECVMFEDAPYAMRAAKEAGMQIFAIEEKINLHDEKVMNAIFKLAQLYVMDFFEAIRKLFPEKSE